MTTGSTLIDDLANLPERIRASRDRLDGLTEASKKERQQRNELIVEAVDHGGVSAADAARAAGLTQTQVLRILGDASGD
jgi:hypothetical protein